MINKSSNMDTYSKRNTIEKVKLHTKIKKLKSVLFFIDFFKFDKMEFKIGYPEYATNETVVNDIYRDVSWIIEFNF
jgi:hypothetical protein